MSAIAERAIVFYLTHPDVVDEVEMIHGQVHQVHNCPDCDSSLVLRDGELVSIGKQAAVLSDEELPVNRVKGGSSNPPEQGEEELVPC